MQKKVVLIFDIGKTNKKYIIFDSSYEIIEEYKILIPEITDEDNMPCDDLNAITEWMMSVLQKIMRKYKYSLMAINFSSYGATMVHLDENNKPVTPLYNYLKSPDNKTKVDFFKKFGGSPLFSKQTGSPAFGMLNSGFQLFWLKECKPKKFKLIKKSLHFPQYLNFIFSGVFHTDMTSVGCHTGLWNITEKKYHSWLKEEDILKLLQKVEATNHTDTIHIGEKKIKIGIGIHDSSAALLPYKESLKDPFILLSTGTWNISLNIFGDRLLTWQDYCMDCLYYFLSKDQPVIASRIFLGYENEYQCNQIEKFFKKRKGYCSTILFDQNLFRMVLKNNSQQTTYIPEKMKGTGPFPGLEGKEIDLSNFNSIEEAYHKLMLDHSFMQVCSIKLSSRKTKIKNLIIEGGFARNTLFTQMLRYFLPDWKIYISEKRNGAALGAALAIHESWNNDPIPENCAGLFELTNELTIDCNIRYTPYF